MRADEKVKKKSSISKNVNNLKGASHISTNKSEDKSINQTGKSSLIKFNYLKDATITEMGTKRKKKRNELADDLREQESSDNNEMEVTDNIMENMKGNCSTDNVNKQNKQDEVNINTTELNINTTEVNINATEVAGTKRIKELYKHTDKGPYNILIAKTNIDSYEVALKVSKYNVKGINNIIQVSKNTIRVNFKDYNTANKLINMNDYDTFKDYNMFIPYEYVSTYGIIRNIPTYISIEEIKKNITSDTPVMEVERMNFWNKELKQSQPGTSIKINFRTQVLPKEVKLYYVINKVELFINKPLICKKCLNYGHTKKFCKSEEVCNNCTAIKHDDNIICKPVCKQCKSNASFTHKTADYKCPVYIEQVDIKKTMTIKKITYKEAKELKNKINGPKVNIVEQTQSSTKYADAVKQNLTPVINKDDKTAKTNTKTTQESEMVKNIMKIFEDTRDEQCKDIILMRVLNYLTTQTENGAKNDAA